MATIFAQKVVNSVILGQRGPNGISGRLLQFN